VVATLVLWDIDGTLVRAGDVGAAVFDDALEEVLGRRPPERVRMSGKTDPQIVGEYLAMLGLPDTPAIVDDVCEALARCLAAAADRLVGEGHACLGAEAALMGLADAGGVVSTAVTGNIEPNAQVKLAAYGLDRWLDLGVGAYGSDARDRDHLVPIAVGRVQERYGGDVDRSRTWVVGDTPRDLACARAGGVRCLLVGTGRTPAAELRHLGADAVLDDLVDTAAVLDILLTGRGNAGDPGR
jgi:phosphoglycolate phosphatase-like HAD superfamily hydrolase